MYRNSSKLAITIDGIPGGTSSFSRSIRSHQFEKERKQTLSGVHKHRSGFAEYCDVSGGVEFGLTPSSGVYLHPPTPSSGVYLHPPTPSSTGGRGALLKENTVVLLDSRDPPLLRRGGWRGEANVTHPTFFYAFICKITLVKKAILIASLLITACTPAVSNEREPVLPFIKTREKVESQALEQVPAELSVEYFSEMALSGTGLTLGTVLADNSDYTRYSITYFSNGLKISGIMNIPKGEGPFPLIVLNHGYIAQSVYTNGRGLKREQDFLARQNFAVIHPDYRGYAFSDPSPDERMIYDASLEYSMDSANAILAVRDSDLEQVDAGHVGMLGHSLGGGITLNIAVAHPELVDAAILYAPVHSDAWENFMKWRGRREEGDRTHEALGTREENPEDWDALSSLTHLDRISVPVLLFHGAKDESVPKDWSDFLAEKLKELDKEVTYIEYEGEKHEFISKWEDFMQRTTAFLHEHLTEETTFTAPLDRADERVTKKPFGIFITPETSPVQPEKFTGYHTGTDFELLPGENASDIEVRAICKGEVIYKNFVSGYGGVLIQECSGDTFLYGHLSLDSISADVSARLAVGDRIGVLGEAFSEETDGERAHLHFAVHRGERVELRGYVGSEGELGGWGG